MDELNSRIGLVCLNVVLRKGVSEIERLLNYGSDLVDELLWNDSRCREISEKLHAYLLDPAHSNVSLLTFWDEDYPEDLKTIDGPPVFLFVKGRREVLLGEKFAVVGTRRITPYGRVITETFVRELCRHFTIVSGLAYGVDSVAHATCLAEGRPTIAVLGNGVDVVYPKSNYKLYSEIVENGCLVSEYLPWESPRKYTFVARNRIVSGLSRGVLVTEAGPESGALITARFAIDQGRDVFAVPGDVNREQSRGTNRLIKDGAYVATEPGDILSQYGMKSHGKLVELSDEEREMIEKLGTVGDAEGLAELLGKPPSEVMVLLTVLELKGLVYRDFDGNFKLTIRGLS